MLINLRKGCATLSTSTWYDVPIDGQDSVLSSPNKPGANLPIPEG